MSKHYVITDVAEDGTITARPIDHNESIMPGLRRPDPFSGELRQVFPDIRHPQQGHVILATVTGIADVLGSSTGSAPEEPSESPRNP